MPLSKQFDTFELAFDYCRERNRPVVVIVAGEKWKLYPSGAARQMGNQHLAKG